MRYSGMANVPGAPGNFPVSAGALNDLVYRGEPVQAMPMPYYGAPVEIQPLAQGIPAFQDPRFPMTQDQFEREVEELRFNKKYQVPGSFRQEIKNYLKSNPLGLQASAPANFDAKYVS
jgi:hypothetical protein